VAVKIQYPGIRQSIESDVDNVALLLRMVKIVPKDFDLTPLLEEAKQQLHQEADYRVEAEYMNQYGASLSGFEQFKVPTPHQPMTTERVLVMTWCEGVPIDQLAQAREQVRYQIAHDLIHLFFHELFVMEKVQTDPNFANFLYHPTAQQIQLLDFGATRVYLRAMISAYRDLLRCALKGDRVGSFSAAQRIGYFSGSVTDAQRDAVLDLFELVLEPLRSDRPYNFAQADLAQRVRDVGMRLSLEQEYWHSPPVAALFLHRKLAGLYLLAVRLQAEVDLRPLRRWLESSEEKPPAFLQSRV
jgi:predicted unusual protein kinase regulating ubiquinone biosynthesis (AarF/ABC1/UbiB family)